MGFASRLSPSPPAKPLALEESGFRLFGEAPAAVAKAGLAHVLRPSIRGAAAICAPAQWKGLEDVARS